MESCKKLNVQLPRSLRGARQGSSTSENEDDSSDERCSAGIRNPHYNMEWLLYLVRTIFPIACLLDHSLLYLNNALLSDDNNASSEAWNKVIIKSFVNISILLIESLLRIVAQTVISSA
jgi:hypothetical protein